MLAESSPLRIAIDARYWRSGFQTGIERYIHLVLEAIAADQRRSNRVEAVGLFLRAAEASFFDTSRDSALPIEVVSLSDRHPRTLNRALAEFEPSIVHFPFDLPSQLVYPSVFTLHDPGRYLFPELMTRSVREDQSDRLRVHLQNPLLRAVVTVSHASSNDIERVFGELPCRLVVVPNFVSGDFTTMLKEAQRESGRRASDPYLLAVGVYMPTKNIPRLCRAFRLLSTAPSSVPKRLVLVGRAGWERRIPRSADGDIIRLGHVGDAELARLYVGCSAFLFPSLYEGFGIPVHEALLAGSRVLCSDIPVFHEIADDLVHYADPTDEKRLADGIIETCTNAAPDGSAVRRWLGGFTSEIAGRALVDVYDAAAR